MSAHSKISGSQVAMVVVSASIAIVGASQAWAFTRIIEHGKEISATQANRFTANDGLEVWKEIGEIRVALTNNDPPQWLVDRLDRMQAQLNQIESKIGD